MTETNPQTPELIADFEGTTSEGGAMMFTAYYGEDEMPYRTPWSAIRRTGWRRDVRRGTLGRPAVRGQ
jgi:hypothetical protein